MPNRVLRDELLTSERWWSVSAEARSLWISIFLSADDLGRCPGSNFVCRTKYMAGIVSHERVEKLVGELMDVDLIRVYEVGGSRYFLVPRFRQFVRFTRSRYPEPPKEINDINAETQCLSTAQALLEQRLSIQKRSEEKRSEEKENNTKGTVRAARSPFVLPDWIPEGHWNAWLDMRQKSRKPATDWAKELAVLRLQELREQGYPLTLVIAEATLKNWLSFYPPKKETTK